MSRARKQLRGAPRHVAQVPLRPTPRMRSVIDTRFHSGLRVYNACLAEALRRSRALRADPRFEEAKALPKGKDRSQVFHKLDEEAGFSERALMSFGSALRQSWVRDQVLSQEAQTLARRAFRAAERWHFGKGGKPRFKNVRRGIRSLECKDANGSLRVKAKDGALVGLQWGNSLLVPFAKPANSAQQAELDRITGLVAAGKLISCRITRAMVRGRWAYRAQLVLDGLPPVRHPVGSERVSIDMGPSTVHVVSQTTAQHFPLAPGVASVAKALRRAQRKLDRQHRKGSPSCFDAQHRHKSDGCDWKVRSRTAQRTQVKVAEVHRVRAARRATEHGEIANDLIRRGPHLRAEKLNYTAWQKRFPGSVRDRAPGSFIAELRYKAASAGGRLYEYAPGQRHVPRPASVSARPRSRSASASTPASAARWPTGTSSQPSSGSTSSPAKASTPSTRSWPTRPSPPATTSVGRRRRGTRLAPPSSKSTGAVLRGTARWYGSPSASIGATTELLGRSSYNPCLRQPPPKRWAVSETAGARRESPGFIRGEGSRQLQSVPEPSRPWLRRTLRRRR